MDTRIKTLQFGIGEIFAEGWRVYRSQFVRILLISFSVYIPLEIFTWLFRTAPLIVNFGTTLFAPIASVAIAYVVERAIQGQDVAWSDAMRHGLSRWPAVFGTSFVAGLILLGLSLLLIIPGVIWSVYYAFYIYVVALRGIWGKEALDYSKDLVQGQWWRVVGIWLVITAVLFGATLVIALPFVIVASVSGIQILVNLAGVVNSVATALFTVIMVVWFLNIDYLKNAVPAAGERDISRGVRLIAPPPDLWEHAPTEPTMALGAGTSAGSESLADRLRFGPLTLSEAVRVVNVLAEELGREENVHHNLSPEYVRYDERENPPLTGLAAPGDIVSAAPEYMSPEEGRGEAPDLRSEIYSLGAVIYRALIGRPPFEGATEQGVMYKVATEPPRPPRELRPDLPEAIGGVLLKALSKQPIERYQTAAEFARAFSASAESEMPIETVQPTGHEAAAPIAAASRPPQPEVATVLAPLPAGQAADAKKRGVDPWLIVGGAGALALCLCFWFGALLYAYFQTSAPNTSVSEFSTPTPARERSLGGPTLLAPTPGATPEPEAAIWFWSANYSPDGKQILASLDDKSLRVWDAATGTQLAAQPGRGETREAMYSLDGTRILTTDGSSESHEYYASVWDARLEKELLRLSGHTSHLFRARFDPQGKQIATASEDGTARIWDAATGTQRLFLVQHDYWILDPVYSPDGKQLATQAESGYLEVWDAETGKKLASFSAWSPGYSPDSKRIVMTRDDNTAWVWDTATWTKLIVLSGHTDRVWGASYSPNGKQIVTRGKDRTARIWDAETGKQLAVLDGHARTVSTSIYSPDSRYVVTATYGDPARVWNVRTGELVATLGLKRDGVDVAVFSPDGRQLFTGNEDGTAHEWDTATWRELVEWTTRAPAATPLPPQATTTAQAAQALLQTTSTWPVVLSDPFDRASNDWTVDSYDSSMGKASKDIAGGKYKWTLSANQPWVSRDIPGVGTASDFVVGVEGRRVSGPNTCGYGVSLRDDYHSLYLLVVNDDQTWRFGRADTYSPLIALAHGSSPAIKPGGANLVQVVARGQIYTLFVNGAFVGEVRDAALEGNSIGIGVEMVKAGDVCEFEFDNFELRAP